MPGAVILLHDGDGYDPHGDRTQTAEALPGIIRDARDAGFEFATAGGVDLKRSRRWIWWVLGFAGVAVALKALAGFPWEDTVATLINANYWVLGVALVINLGSLVAKGWAWHSPAQPSSPPTIGRPRRKRTSSGPR